MASHAEAAELEACTYPATTWHRKKGHSSLRNSLRTWRHRLVIRREATERVFPAPSPTSPPPQARLAHEGWWDLGREWRACGMLPLPSDPQLWVALNPLACSEGRSHPGLDSANSALWAEPGCHRAQATAERARASPDAGIHVPSLAVPSQLSWVMGKLTAVLAGRDSQPIPMEAAVCLAGRGPV